MFFKSTTALATAGLMLGTAATASSDTIPVHSFDKLPKEGRVTLTGTIDKVRNGKEFTLRDKTGATIDIDTETRVAFRQGDRVEVVGMIDDFVLGIGKEVDASKVTLLEKADHSEASAHVNVEESESVTGVFYRIDDLPDDGAVTLIGWVTDIDAEDNTFRVKGKSGETIDVHSPELMAVKAGQKVKVQGQMNDELAGVIGEEIVAAKVTVLS